MKKIFLCLAIVVTGIMIFTGCSTKVHLVVTKPAEVNLSGVRNLSVLDFEYAEDNQGTNTLDKILDDVLQQFFLGSTDTSLSKEEKIAQYAKSKMIQTLSDTQYFILIDAGEFKDSVGAMSDRLQFFEVLSGVYDVDAVMIGTIPRMDSRDSYEIRTRVEKNPDTGEEYEIQEQWVTRTSELELEYKIVSTADSSLIVQKVFSKTISDSELQEDFHSLTSAEQMYHSMIDSIIKTISRQIVPYQVTESRSLMRDKTKDPQMKLANEYVKVAKYDDAKGIFLKIWESSRNIAAGYNAAIMYEAQGDLDSAISQMADVLDVYPEKKIFRALERLKASKIQYEKAMAQMEGR